VIRAIAERRRSFFAARRSANADTSCHRVSVRLPVRQSHAGIVSRRLTVRSRKECHTTVQGLWFSDAKDLVDTRMVSLPMKVPNTPREGRFCAL